MFAIELELELGLASGRPTFEGARSNIAPRAMLQLQLEAESQF